MGSFFTVITYLLAGIIGLCIGGFLNAIILSVSGDSVSRCRNCGRKFDWYDRIPLISYCILRGRCRNCKAHIPLRIPGIELLNMLLWLACVALFWGKSIPYAVIAAAVCSLGICIAFIDIDHLFIPDLLQIILLALGAVSIPFCGEIKWYSSHLIGSAAGFVLFFAIAKLGKKISGHEVLGGGDVMLAAGMGLLLGLDKLMLSILVASVTGSIVILPLHFVRRDEKGKMYPFGPWLVFGMIFSMFFGDAILSWYVSLLTGI